MRKFTFLLIRIMVLLLLLYYHISLIWISASFISRIEVSFVPGTDVVPEQLNVLLAKTRSSKIQESLAYTDMGMCRLMSTDENYPGFREIDIVEGSFFSEEAVRLKMNVAVIDEVYLKQLSPDSPLLGKDIEINGMNYRVIGICRYRLPILSEKASSVFVPIGSSATYNEDILFNTFYIEASGMDSYYIRSEVQQALISESPAKYSMIDYAEAFQLLRQSFYLFIWYLELTAAVLLILWAICVLKKDYAKMRLVLKQLYLAEYLKSNAVDWMLHINILLLCILVTGLLVYQIFSFQLSLPYGLLTYDSLFDCNHYYRWFANFVQTYLYGNQSVLHNYMAMALPGGYVFLFLECWSVTKNCSLVKKFAVQSPL